MSENRSDAATLGAAAVGVVDRLARHPARRKHEILALAQLLVALEIAREERAAQMGPQDE